MPEPERGEVRLRILVCGVCHTEIDEIEGRTPPPRLPIVPGHEVVGIVDALGPGAHVHQLGDRVGVGWIYDSCGECAGCREGRENLCPDFTATGRDVDGGYAEYMNVPERSAYRVPDTFDSAEAAPLLCAGGVGYRSLRLTQLRDGEVLGFYGFGASAHLVLQIARHEYPRSPIYVFSRSLSKQEFSRSLGADWAGPPESDPPGELAAVIDTTPVWRPIEQGLRHLLPGGRLVVNAIRKEDGDKDSLLDISYDRHLWMERMLTSVANVTRNDIRRALEIAAEVPVRPTVERLPLHEANRALVAAKEGSERGAKVLVIHEE